MAPDSASEVAGRRLAVPAPWSDVGWADPLLWGSCQGSGKTPYTVAVDISGPTYRCSCPSRKFPCKHVLGLLFLWSEGRIRAGGEVSAFASDWVRARARDEGPDDPLPESRVRSPQTPEQAAAAAARATRREERVAGGLADLDRWLADRIGRGLAAVSPGEAADMAAHMVDAQAPGLAARLREAERIPRNTRWLSDTFTAYSLMHLLCRAATSDASGPLRETIRMRTGFTTPREAVLATPPVSDRWLVAGMRDSEEEQVGMRRVWLRGLDTGAPAMVLFFAPPGQTLSSPLLPGTVVQADLHFYPGQPRLRAVVGAQRDTVGLEGRRPATGGVADAVTAWRAALAVDPWLTEWPVVVTGAPAPSGARWTFTGSDGTAVDLVGSDVWTLLALTGGRPAIVLGELSAAGFRPQSVVLDDEAIPL